MWESHTGALCAAVAAGASTTTMDTAPIATPTAAPVASRSDTRHRGVLENFGLRAKSASAQTTLAHTQWSRAWGRAANAGLRGPLTLTTHLSSETRRS